MKRQKKPKLTVVQKMAVSKRKLIERLNDEIRTVDYNADIAKGKIRSRIRIAQTILSALENGELKP